MYVEVDLDQPRKLRYDFNAISDVEERAGMGVGAMFNEHHTGFNTIRLLIWGGLKWKERGLTVDRAGTFINEYLKNGGELDDLMGKVREALEKSGIVKFVEIEEEEDEEGNMEAGTE